MKKEEKQPYLTWEKTQTFDTNYEKGEIIVNGAKLKVKDYLANPSQHNKRSVPHQLKMKYNNRKFDTVKSEYEELEY